MKVYIDAIGVCGPSLQNWECAQTALKNGSHEIFESTSIPVIDCLPAAERRRVGTAVKLALAAATDAFSINELKPSDLLSVFCSSGGDGDNCHAICEALATDDRLLSPTRFTNSVHNAPSGYWGIALKAKPASTSICAFDAGFAAGFLEASTQSISFQEPVLLVVYDTPYPEPLHTVRHIAYSVGIALIVNHKKSANTLASLDITLGKDAVTLMENAAFEALRQNVPAARGLPLLQAIAQGCCFKKVVIDYFDNQQLILNVDTVACKL